MYEVAHNAVGSSIKYSDVKPTSVPFPLSVSPDSYALPTPAHLQAQINLLYIVCYNTKANGIIKN